MAEISAVSYLEKNVIIYRFILPVMTVSHNLYILGSSKIKNEVEIEFNFIVNHIYILLIEKMIKHAELPI